MNGSVGYLRFILSDETNRPLTMGTGSKGIHDRRADSELGVDGRPIVKAAAVAKKFESGIMLPDVTKA